MNKKAKNNQRIKEINKKLLWPNISIFNEACGLFFFFTPLSSFFYKRVSYLSTITYTYGIYN
jgi:hypothetical protein